MATRTTLGALVDDYFRKTLLVTSIGDMKIAITNDPDFDAKSFKVTAAGTRRDYAYPLFGNKALALKDIGITLAYNGPGKPATGTIAADLNFGGIDLNVTITLSRQTESFSVASQMLDPISLMKVVDMLSGGKSVAPPGLEKTAIKSFAMDIAHDAKAGWTVRATGKLNQKWKLPIGRQSVDAALSAVYQGTSSLKLKSLGVSGAFTLGQGRTMTLAYAFGRKLSQLTGTLDAGGPPIVIADLMKLFGIRIAGTFPDTLASPKGVDLASGAMTLDFETPAVQISGRNSLAQDAFVRAEKIGTKWGVALGIGTGPGWKMADLAKALKPVDDFLSFRQSFVAISTADMEIDDSVFAALGKHRFHLNKGLTVGAAIHLDNKQTSPLAKALHGLLGGDIDLFLEGGIGADREHVFLNAALEDLHLQFDVPGKRKKQTLHISGPHVEFTLQPALSLGGIVAFPTTQPGETIDVGGRVEFEAGPAGVAMTFSGFVHDHKQQLPPPKNATGVQLHKIGGLIKAAPDVLELGLDGSMTIGTEAADFAFDFAVAPELMPTFLYAHFTRLDLAPMFAALCTGGKLPKGLRKGIEFENVTIFSCTDPSGHCSFSDGTPVKEGFGFSGDANVFGFPADAALSITTAGMSGKLEMGKAVSIPGIVTLSDAHNRKKGPVFDFNTSTSPYMDADYLIDILGVTNKTDLHFTNEGFWLKTSITFKKRTLWLRCVLGATRPGHYTFTIEGGGDFTRNPIDIVHTAWGMLRLTEIDIHLYADKALFSVHAEARIGKVIKRHADVHISLKTIGNDLKKLGGQLERVLGNHKHWN